ncbi:response regulator [Amaricoccus macauensis]|uniref:response regulator n=1 Tax=Amaricoccus macauensis TaxID=57001 RepID=UPI003C7C9903
MDDDMKELKILLVDDDRTALEELGETVEIEGWTYVTANSIETALELLDADESIRVVVTDVHFVDDSGNAANGIQFVSRAQARFADRSLSYLVLSGDPDALQASVQVGAFNFLCKPFMSDDLITAIRKAVRSGGEKEVSAASGNGIREALERARENDRRDVAATGGA